MKDAVVITCDRLPCPPLNGHNKKTHDLLAALAESYSIECLVYPETPEQLDALAQYWSSSGIRFTSLRRRRSLAALRSLGSRLSLPTVTRDFQAEEQIIRERIGKGGKVRALIDFISGAPLLSRFRPRQGFVLSGHDCMSYLFGEERRYARDIKRRCHHAMRRQFALHAEKKYAHRAEVVHLVSDNDAVKLREVNNEVRTHVIPISGSSAIPSNLLPYEDRTRKVIWGFLGSDLILAGARKLLHASLKRGPHRLAGWQFLGGLPEHEAFRRLPELRETGLEYTPRATDLGAFLGSCRSVLLPDVSGTGQKNRTTDCLAHGCCVFGLAEVFRGIGSEGAGAFLVARDFDELSEFAENERQFSSPALSQNAMRLFESAFSFEVLRQRWCELIESIHPLPAS